jgi:hypothetical protein
LEIGGLELTRLGGKKDIEPAPPALVRLEERDVAQHLCGFVAFGQNDPSIGPQPELLGRPDQVRLIARGDRRAQNASHRSADRTIHRQRFVASHRCVLS